MIVLCDRSEYFVENCDKYFAVVRNAFYKAKNILYDDYEFIFDGDIYKINKKRLCKRMFYAKSQVQKLDDDRVVISFEIVIPFVAVCLFLFFLFFMIAITPGMLHVPMGKAVIFSLSAAFFGVFYYNWKLTEEEIADMSIFLMRKRICFLKKYKRECRLSFS